MFYSWYWYFLIKLCKCIGIVLIPVDEFRYFDKMMTFLYSLVFFHPFSVHDGEWENGEWERQDLIYISFSRRHKNSAAITSFVPPSVVAGTTDPCGSRTVGGTVVTSSSFSSILHFSLIKGNTHLLVADANHLSCRPWWRNRNLQLW